MFGHKVHGKAEALRKILGKNLSWTPKQLRYSMQKLSTPKTRVAQFGISKTVCSQREYNARAMKCAVQTNLHQSPIPTNTAVEEHLHAGVHWTRNLFNVPISTATNA